MTIQALAEPLPPEPAPNTDQASERDSARSLEAAPEPGLPSPLSPLPEIPETTVHWPVPTRSVSLVLLAGLVSLFALHWA